MKALAALLLFLLFWAHTLHASESLTMVYRTTAKTPFINTHPSNEGIWKSVYSRAATKIGLTLNIERYPKKRAYKLLDEGDVDFYPASSFNAQREKIGYFIKNYLSKEGVVVLYRDDLPIETIEDIRGYELLNNLGSTTTFYDKAGIDLHHNTLRKVSELDIKRAIGILQRKTSDVYAYSDIGIEDFIENREIPGVKKLIVNGQALPSVLIFSKHSAHYKEKVNPNYDPKQALSLHNLPYTLDETCVAYKFKQALKAMKQSGEIDAILRAYDQ